MPKQLGSTKTNVVGFFHTYTAGLNRPLHYCLMDEILVRQIVASRDQEESNLLSSNFQKMLW